MQGGDNLPDGECLSRSDRAGVGFGGEFGGATRSGLGATPVEEVSRVWAAATVTPWAQAYSAWVKLAHFMQVVQEHR